MKRHLERCVHMRHEAFELAEEVREQLDRLAVGHGLRGRKLRRQRRHRVRQLSAPRAQARESRSGVIEPCTSTISPVLGEQRAENEVPRGSEPEPPALQPNIVMFPL